MATFREGETSRIKANHALQFPFKSKFPIIIDILRNHPINTALTAGAIVPEKHIFDLWTSIKYEKAKKKRQIPEYLTFNLENDRNLIKCDFFLSDFRTIIGFPELESYENLTAFEPLPDVDTMLAGVRRLGYDGPLDSMPEFFTHRVHILWNTLYAVISHCLLPAQKGHDKMTKPALSLYFAISHGVRCDYAQIVWDKMCQVVRGKNLQDRKYIPFVRFFTLIIRHFMNQHREIPELEDSTPCSIPFYDNNLRSPGTIFVRPMPIPDYLLRLVPDETNPHLRSYRAYLATITGSENLQIPTPIVHRSPSEGPSTRSKRKRGDSGEGASGHKRRSKRRSKKVDDDDEQEVEVDVGQNSDIPTTQSTPYPTSQTTPSYTQSSPQTTPIPTFSTPEQPILSPQQQSSQVLSPSPIASTLTVNPLPGHHLKSIPKARKKMVRISAKSGVMKVSEKKIEKKKKSKKSKSSSSESPQETPVVSQQTQGMEPIIEDWDAEEEEASEEQGRFEGAVENFGEDERSGLGQGQKENVGPSIDETHRSSQDVPIGLEVESSSLSHAQTSPRHSDPSKQGSVSQTHGELPRTPRSSHLEVESVEQREDQPHLSPSFQSLESSPPRNTLDPDAQLRASAGTSREDATLCTPRGPLGSPSLANTMPAFVGGTTSPRDVGSPGNLSDPGMVRNVTTLSIVQESDLSHSEQQDLGCEANRSSTVGEDIIQGSTGNLESVMMTSSHTQSVLTTSELDNSSLNTLVSSKANQEAVLNKIQIRKTAEKALAIEEPTSSSSSSLPSIPKVILLPMLAFDPRVVGSSDEEFTEGQGNDDDDVEDVSDESDDDENDDNDDTFPSQSQPIQTQTTSKTTTTPLIIPTTATTTSQPPAQTKDELCTLLHTLLLTESSLNAVDRGVLNALEIRQSTLEKEREMNELKANMIEFERRLKALESCRPASVSRRDDHDHDDHPEGESRGEGHVGDETRVEEAVDVETTNVEGGDGGNQEEVDDVVIEEVEDPSKTNKLDNLRKDSEDFWERLYGDIEKERKIIHDVFEQFEDVEAMFVEKEATPTPSYTSLPSTPQPYSFENFQGFDELRKTPEAAAQSFEKNLYKQILQEAYQTDETLPDIFPTDFTEEQRRFINQGYFFEDKARLVELGIKPKEAAKKSKFLEERAYPIFCGPNRITETKKPEEMSMYKFKQPHQVKEYLDLLKLTKYMNPNLIKMHKKYRIKSVVNVKLVSKLSISVPTIYVLRSNNKEYRISEAHFQHLPVEDIIFLYNHFATRITRFQEDLIAFEAIKRYMSSVIQFASLEDFQIGFELVKRKINLAYPNQTLYSDDIEQIKIGHIVKKPSAGIVFFNSQKKKIFIRFKELAAYSDGTLEYCKKVLTCLKDDEEDEEKKRTFDQAIAKIDKRLVLRENIRKLRDVKNVKHSENIVRRRGGSWIRYNPSHVIGDHNRPPEDLEENMFIPEGRPEGENWFWHPNKRYVPRQPR